MISIAVPTNDIYGFGSLDTLITFGAGVFMGTGFLRQSTSGIPVAFTPAAGTPERKALGTSHTNVSPVLFNDKVNQIFGGLGNAPSNTAIILDM